MVFNRGDYIAYILLNGSAVDRSLNAYTVTVNGTVTYGNNDLSLASMAAVFNNVSANSLSLPNAAQQKIAIAINNAITISVLYVPTTSKTGGVFSAYYNSIQNSFNLQNNVPTANQTAFSKFDGSTYLGGVVISETAIDLWRTIGVTTSGSAVSSFLNGVADATATVADPCKENSTGLAYIGRRGDVSVADALAGRVCNLQVMDKTTTIAERFFMNQWSNRLLVA